jgi:hypothetical protein
MKAIKIALLYWLQRALRLFCPHSNNEGARRCHAPVCPTCALWMRVHGLLSALCGIQAIYKVRKCDLCFEPLADQSQQSTVHLACAERENARAELLA